MTLEKNSYDYVYEAAVISASVSANYMLSMDQHRHLLVDSIPSSPEKNLISKCTTLENLLNVISTLAPCLKTRSQIESEIKQWSLVTLSTETITRSVSKLTDLIEAINSDAPLSHPDLFRAIISRILLEKLPERVSKELVEARHKIASSDNLNTLLQLLLSVLYSLAGYKPRPSTNQGTGFPQVKAIQEQPEKSEYANLVPHLVAAVQAASAQSVVPVPPPLDPRNSNAGVPKQNKNNGGGNANNPNNGKNSNGSTGSKNPQSAPKSGKSNGNSNGNKRKFKKKFSFVTPWPENKPYTSKSGNSLSKECEEHFDGYCFRCGMNSHRAERCRIYTDKTVIITLCSECRQGFHDQCKNYKKVNQRAITNQVQSAPLSLEHLSAQLRTDLEDILGRARPYSLYEQVPSGHPAITDGTN
jgi:hypothetical protein